MIFFVLYIVLNNDKLKIGKTTSENAYNRFSLIERDFGQCDLDHSYFVFSKSKEEIDNLERLLHRSFYGDNKPLKSGSGKTEWFSVNVLKKTLDHIEYLRKNNKNYKGVSSPIKGIPHKHRKKEILSKSYFKKVYIYFYNISLICLMSFISYYSNLKG